MKTAQNELKSMKIKHGKLYQNDKWYAYAMISPVVLGFACLMLFPLLYEFYLSLTNAKLLGNVNFIGFENYENLFGNDPLFTKSILNSLYFSGVLVPLNISLAILLAVLLNRQLRGIGIFRTLVFLPSITPIVVWALVWKLILSTDAGILNAFLKIIGITGPAWLFDVHLTMPVLIVNTVLKGVGLNMVIFLGALKSIPVVYYEAAMIDGAKPFRTFVNVTLPMLSPTIFMVTVTTIISSLKIFSNVYMLTNGGPANSTSLLVFYIYYKAFKEFNFGYAAAIAAVLFVIILIITLIQWSLRRRLVYAENE